MLTWGRRPRRKTNGKHKVNTGRRESEGPVSLRAAPGPTLGTLFSQATVALPSLTSGHVTGTEEEGGGKECEAVEGDGREGLSRAEGIQQPDEQTADAEVNGPAVCNHPVVALGSGPVSSRASPTDHPAHTCMLTYAHAHTNAHTPGLTLDPRQKVWQGGSSRTEDLGPCGW